jgi:hypothetical protein
MYGCSHDFLHNVKFFNFKAARFLSALAEIARRYFTSHGPATLQDFVWWTGLAAAEAKAGLEMIKADLMQEEIDGKNYWFPSSVPVLVDKSPVACLLPNFDEYMIGYRDRSAMFPAAYSGKLAPRGNIAFNYTIMINGITVGSWRRESKNDMVVIRTRLFRPLDSDEKEALSMTSERYGKFLGITVLLL